MKCHLAVIVYGKLKTKGIDLVVQICSRPIIPSESRLFKILDFHLSEWNTLRRTKNTAFCFFTFIQLFHIDSRSKASPSSGYLTSCSCPLCWWSAFCVIQWVPHMAQLSFTVYSSRWSFRVIGLFIFSQSHFLQAVMCVFVCACVRACAENC